ncbi:FkbM family methyltransferase [Nitrosospira multiformis]|uniref:FkbM family methyltransferase n=1 Tax=Nitrosospira multiformis TaxID=1231 RepID=UPI0008953A3E|nr:FkbM family methyltransferase [Nitrosospira multiformis]SDZ77875.1 methyltransferase, FkbM family [Nitrosospira multiformis]
MNKVFAPLKRISVSVGKRLAPDAYALFKFKSLGRDFHEPELRLLPYLCDSRKTSLDIGASEGLYMAHLLKLSAYCIAFEARPAQAARLKFILTRVTHRASVESVALSDSTGETKLRTLVEDPGRSTIEISNLLEDEDGSNLTEVTVPVRRLDDYALDNVGFAKIDVEGHELAVLKGGEDTVRRHRPSLLIEIEDRHRKNAIRDVTDFLADLDYSGFFILNDLVRPLNEFDRELHQDSRNIGGWKSHWERKGVYINNFIFVPSEKRQEFTRFVLREKW